MNILLTDKCSNDCPYCFAREKLEADLRLNQMPLSNFQTVLEFLRRSRSRHVKLLGGEPMLHSEIRKILEISVSDKDFDNITVFTGGIFDRSLADLLVHEKINIVINSNHPDDYKGNKWDLFMTNLNRLVTEGADVTIGYNIYRPDFDYGFILDLLECYRIKNLRWTIAVPMGSYGNRHVPLEGYQEMGRRITGMLLAIADMGVQSRLDCFLPLCTFSDSDYGRLIKIFPGMARGGLCRPAIDVGPDLSVWRCFSVSQYENVVLSDFADLNALTGYFMSTFDHYKWHVYPEKCRECSYRAARICQSSCLSFKAGEIERFLSLEKEAQPAFKEAGELFIAGKYLEASARYQEALDIAPYSLHIRAESAICLIRTGCLAKAEKLLDEIEKEYPEYPAQFVYRAVLHEARGELDKAVAAYRRARKLCPGDEELRERIRRLGKSPAGTLGA
ncbi:MAG: radical SAM protein [Vulcanimicrobiota bacterium]